MNSVAPAETEDLFGLLMPMVFNHLMIFQTQTVVSSHNNASLLSLTFVQVIMDWLDQRQIIDIGWHRLKDVMESATTLEMAKRNGEEND